MKPIVLAHGYLGFDALESINYFNGVAAHLGRQFQVQVYAPRVEPKQSVPDRATELLRNLPDQQVHVIAHSMGGLDARYLLLPSKDSNNRIASLTTVSTPHSGTYLADIAMQAGNPAALLQEPRFRQVSAGLVTAPADLLRQFTQGLFQHPLSESLAKVRECLDQIEPIVSAIRRDDAAPLAAYIRKLFALSDNALPDLTTAGCRSRFAGEPAPLIPCFSYAASGEPFTTLAPPFVLSYLILKAVEGPNDGLVSVTSASSWGTPKATFPADHAGVIGWSYGNCLPWYDQMVNNILANVPQP